MSNVLLTGGGGYIGSILTKQLLEAGHRVTVLDWFAFGDKGLEPHLKNKNLTVVHEDVRLVTPARIKGHDVICDLAALSNDPLGDLDPQITRQVNFEARARLGRIGKAVGVQRYLLASSCSVYGLNGDVSATETSATDPQTTYAECNVLAEDALFALSDDSFSVTSFRNATAFGLSDRMRFDSVVNIMTLSAFKGEEIRIFGDGRQHRPFVHIADISRAFIAAIAAPVDVVEGQIFNLGHSNIQICDLAKTVVKTIPGDVDLTFIADNADNRDYSVSFDKIRTRLKFTPQVSVTDGIMEVYFALLTGATKDTPQAHTVDWYAGLIREGRELKHTKQIA